MIVVSRLEDAELFITNGAYNCARAIFAQLLSVFPSDEAIWIRAAEFEKEHGTQFVLSGEQVQFVFSLS